MFHELKKQMWASVASVVFMTLLLGFAYPLAVTGVAQAIFPSQANGSILAKNGKSIGSALIGQVFTSPQYFWGRPSATGPDPNNAAASAGSNLGPTNPALTDAVRVRIETLRATGIDPKMPIPIDLVTASASGLDPDISPAAAAIQIPRIAAARKMPEAKLRDIVLAHVEGRSLGLFGEPRVNVLRLNLDLDSPRRASLESSH